MKLHYWVILDSRSAIFWDITQGRVVIPQRRFGTNYRVPSSSTFFLTLEDGTGRLSPNVGYHYALRNIPEKRWSRLHRGGSLKSWFLIYLTALSQLHTLCIVERWMFSNRRIRKDGLRGRGICKVQPTVPHAIFKLRTSWQRCQSC